MKNILLFGFFFMALIFSGCSDDEGDEHHDDFEYHAHIHAPNSDDRHMEDMMHIEVLFESHSGMPVHHINVRIYNKSTEEEIYNKPDMAHVHETSGEYEFHDHLALTEANGFSAHSDWVLEAKVWGHEAGEGEEISTVEFHVHPEK